MALIIGAASERLRKLIEEAGYSLWEGDLGPIGRQMGCEEGEKPLGIWVDVDLPELLVLEPECPPGGLTCHNPRCYRYGQTMAELQAKEGGTDPFYWVHRLAVWACPDCGGTDVY